MWYQEDPRIINAKVIENFDYGIIFNHRYLSPIMPSKRTVKRDFLIEKKRSFGIAGIDFHSYKDELWNSNSSLKRYNGKVVCLEFEPWNEYDQDAIAVYLYGSKLGYIPRHQTEDVHDIITYSKRYIATFDRSIIGYEGVIITFLQEFKDETTLPYQTDLVLTASCAPSVYKKFIKGNIGHTVTFAYSYEKKKMAMLTDMNSTLGYIDDSFIERQNQKTPIIGFEEDAKYDEDTRVAEVKLRLLMEKSVISKNYLKSYQALSKHFGQFYDAGVYCISLSDLVKVAPRKSSRSISAYEPLVKYLKEYHAIQLIIEQS